MDITKLKRDPNLAETVQHFSGQKVLAKTDCQIVVPVRYESKQMLILGQMVLCVGVYGLVSQGKFCCDLTLAKMPLKPSSISVEKLEDDDDYYIFSFKKGDVMIDNIELVKEDTLVYRIFDDIHAKGNVPWYISPTALAKLFVTAQEHGNINLVSSNASFELIAATMTRIQKDLTKYFRHYAKSLDDPANPDYEFVPLTSVAYGTTNTITRLLGNYRDEGVTAALVHPTETLEPVEKMLRR